MCGGRTEAASTEAERFNQTGLLSLRTTLEINWLRPAPAAKALPDRPLVLILVLPPHAFIETKSSYTRE